MQTAVVPLTEGNKMKMRHQGFSVTLHFGAMKLFMTTNFADTYSPLTFLLYNNGELSSEFAGAGVESASEVLGNQSIDLFEDNPSLPTLRRMHQLVAQHPSIQAKLFLLMEQLTITELLCADFAFSGHQGLGTQQLSA